MTSDSLQPPTGGTGAVPGRRSLGETFRSTLGLLVSLLTYYRPRWPGRALERLYGEFIRRDDLCFDIGAHVGNRVRAWLNLGARIVAVEPHPECTRILQRLYRSQPRVQLVQEAVGARSSFRNLRMSLLNPTVSTFSTGWIESVRRTRGFSRVRWEGNVPVKVTTLDALISQYGEPAFCKIDVEGWEADVLQGLSRPLKALSFEYVPAAVDVALECLELLGGLSKYEFNWSEAETARLGSNDWMGPQAMAQRLRGLPSDARSGDVYARKV
ncbi:MAG TPA: FkbM family methyltransferase [Anaerolineales bacterium]|nr:FkbM family methyltransferase [Anaerolineales bacterium]